MHWILSVLLDEMHVKGDLVYDKYSGSMIGFANLSEINNHMLQFEQSLDGRTHKDALAKSMLVFLVCGLFWEAVYCLEWCSFKVVAATADGATPNPTFFRIHCTKGKEFYHTPNPFSDDDRSIFFFSDLPHLLNWDSTKQARYVKCGYVLYVCCIRMCVCV